MKTKHRLGLFVAMVVAACGVAVTPAYAQNTDPSVDPTTTEDCKRGYTPGQWVDGNPPAGGVNKTLLGHRDSYDRGGGYILNLTLLFDGYSEGWYYVVGSGVPGDYDSRTRGAMLRWCEDYTDDEPDPEPTSNRGGGSIGHYVHTPGSYHMPGITTKWVKWKVTVN